MKAKVEIDDSALKFIKVEGNCCWNFYQRYTIINFNYQYIIISWYFRNRYGGDVKTIRGSTVGLIDFIPKSMKIIAC